ncbi:MAG: hypothetical protein CMJ42_16735 [Phyllobacteriaceae bacterium]|nr:hypothetical protein [Phyllobacteriaceae bacterium]
MNTFVLEIWEDSFDQVTFYTVRWETSPISETDKFFSRFEEDEEEFKEDFHELVALLEDIGNRKGAKPYYFSRQVASISELPPKMKVRIEELTLHLTNNRLRLFCLRLSDHVVILFNGGIKTSQKTQDSPDLSSKLRDAWYFTEVILDELQDSYGSINLDSSSRLIIDDKGNDDQIIFER